MKDCMMDVCQCHLEKACACPQFDVYATQCQNNGFDAAQWRENVAFCPYDCPEPTVYIPDGATPVPTCLNRDPSKTGTVAGCFCPEGQFLQDGLCVEASGCKCLYEGYICDNGEIIEKKAECQTCTCQDVGEMTCQEKVCPTLNCKEDQLEARNDDECCSYCSSISYVTSTPKDITITVDQTLTCNIGGLDPSGTPATVTWKDNDGAEVLTGDTDNYGFSRGSVDGSGNQVAELTIKAAKLPDFTSLSSVTYKCSVQSGQYTDSPATSNVEVEATILTLDVKAKGSEVLTNTEATISCVVSGLSQQLDAVTWKKPSSGGVITDGTDSYNIDIGTYDPGSNSQTTILTVPAGESTADALFTCVIQSDEHAKTSASPEETVVNSNNQIILAVVPETPKKATTPVAQTLTCDIGDVVTDVIVSWKDNAGADITSDSAGYTIAQGSADSGTKIQTSTLTIDVATLTSVAVAANPATYKCAAQSVEYSDSATSTFKEIVVNFLTFDVKAKGSEVLKNTEATISCVVSGLSKQLEAVTWKKPSGDAITDGTDSYAIEVGTYVSGTNIQTTILTVPAGENTADALFTCVIQSDEHAKTSASPEETDVNSNVFTVVPETPKKATTAVAQTLTCDIGDVVTDVIVSWKDNAGADITSDSAGYTIAQGSADSGTKIQTSTLTIDVATLTSVAVAANPATYKCAAQSVEYSDSATSTFKEIVVNFLTFGKFLRTWWYL
ncbi:mucin-17-like [Bolinopsis microptera]|uniref:mucin-17-like n=1 Tax=Bolinopsis microptera TaxID=2820187 RepID=UPI00307AC6F5